MKSKHTLTYCLADRETGRLVELIERWADRQEGKKTDRLANSWAVRQNDRHEYGRQGQAFTETQGQSETMDEGNGDRH